MESICLQHKIEKVRTKLDYLLCKKNPTDKLVVQCSEELDELIVQYQKLLKSEKIA